MKGLMQNSPLLVSEILNYAAKWHADQEIISKSVEGPTIVTNYADLKRRALLCTTSLMKLGIKSGTIVGTMAVNTSRHLEAWYGIMGMGAVCHTLNPRLSDADLEYIINDGGDLLIFVDVTFLPVMQRLVPKCPTVRAVILLTDSQHMPAGVTSIGKVPVLCYERLLDDSSAIPGLSRSADDLSQPSSDDLWRGVAEDDACGLCYTSGTTGKPKGVLYSHRANYLHALALSLPDAMSISSSSVVLPVVPMFHANSWGLVFAGPMNGAALVLPGPNLEGQALYALMDQHKVTMTAGVPTIWIGLLSYLESHPALQLTHLKTLGIGGSAAPRSMVDTLQHKYGVEVRHIWGMTELTPVATLGSVKGTLRGLTPQELVDIKVKQGRPHIMADVRIVDDGGRQMPHDGKAVGNLQVRGPIVVQQYFRTTSPPTCDPQGWFTTGDVASIDSQGHVSITDRSKDVIKSGGEWISSLELEDVAMSHVCVMEAAVVAIPDDKWSERPLVLVVLKQGHRASEELKKEILESYKGRVARYAEPRDLVFIPEIPHNATGKISKITLRARFKDYPGSRSKL